MHFKIITLAMVLLGVACMGHASQERKELDDFAHALAGNKRFANSRPAEFYTKEHYLVFYNPLEKTVKIRGTTSTHTIEIQAGCFRFIHLGQINYSLSKFNKHKRVRIIGERDGKVVAATKVESDEELSKSFPAVKQALTLAKENMEA